MAIFKRRKKSGWQRLKEIVAIGAGTAIIGTGLFAHGRIAAEKREWMKEYDARHNTVNFRFDGSERASVYHFIEKYGAEAYAIDPKAIEYFSDVCTRAGTTPQIVTDYAALFPIASPALPVNGKFKNGRPILDTRIATIKSRVKRGKLSSRKAETIIKILNEASATGTLVQIQEMIDKHAFMKGKIGYMDLERPDIDFLATEKLKKKNPKTWKVVYKASHKLDDKTITGNVPNFRTPVARLPDTTRIKPNPRGVRKTPGRKSA